jgi:PAS domain S-box-containing protein
MVAVVGTAAAALLRWVIGKIVGEIPPFITFYPVTILSAVIGGMWPGLLATFLTALAAACFFIEPRGHLGIASTTDAVALAIFIVINLALSLVGGWLRRAHQASRAASAQLEAIIASMTDALVACDLQGNILIFNPAALRLHGFTTLAEVRKHFHELAGLFKVSDLDGQPLPPEAWPLSRVLRGETFTGHEIRVHRRDTGQEYIGRCSGMIVPGQNGSPTLVIITIQDVTEHKRAAEALRESEERFRAMANAMPQLAWIAQADGFITWYNQRWHEYTGTTPTQVEGWGWQSVHDPAVLPKVLERWKASIATGQPFEMDFPLRGADGRFRQFLTRGFPLKDAEGRVLQWFGTNTDVDDLKQAEAAVREQAQLAQLRADATQALQQPGAMQALLQNVAALLVERLDAAFARVWTLEPSGQTLELQASAGLYTHLNGAHSRVPVGHLKIGRIAQERRPLVTNQVIGDPHVPGQDWARREGLVAFAGFPLLLESRLLGVVALFARHPLSPAAIETFGAVAGALAQALGRKQAEEAQARLAAIVEGSEDAILSKSLEGTIRTWNAGAERMFGYRADEVIGQPVTLFVPPDRTQEENQVLERLKHGETMEHYETVRVTKDGRKLDVSLTISPVKDSQGRIIGASKIVRDIGELVRARKVLSRSKEDLERLVEERTAKLREAIGELEHMSYSMIHDMRAPLRAMISFATLLQMECAACLPPQGLDYFRRIREAADRLDRLVTDALNYNKVLRQEFTTTSVEIGRLLRGMIETYPNLQPAAADIDIQFNELVLLGNESLLTQCFGNLLDNAVKFVAPGVKPRIRVWAESVQSPKSKVQSQPTGHATRNTSPVLPLSTLNHMVRVWIKDNGIGIPKEAHQRIFAMFQRMHGESEYPGTGIGLAIVRKAVERMGGRVGLESEPGKGCAFWIELPKAGEAENRVRLEHAA